jgi:hypothetical protein
MAISLLRQLSFFFLLALVFILFDSLNVNDFLPKQTTFGSAFSSHVTVVVQECTREDLVELQYLSFEAFLEDDFTYNVVVCDSSTSALRALEKLTSKFLRFKVVSCPSLLLTDCYDFSYRHFVNELKESETLEGHYFMFANSDMFLWKRFSIHHYLQDKKADVSSVVETHSGPYYIHPGLVLLNAQKVAGRFASNWQSVKADTGEGTANYLASLSTDFSVNFSPILWSRFFDFKVLRDLRLIPLELFDILESEKAQCPPLKGCLTSDLYLDDFAIIHPRGSSNWQKEEGLQIRIQKIKKFIQSRIAGGSLTWSTSGSTTTENTRLELFSGMYQQRVGNALQYTPFFSKEKIMKSAPVITSPPSKTYPADVSASDLSDDDHSWLLKLYQRADDLNKSDVFPKIKSLLSRGTRLPLPSPDSAKVRSNEHLHPPRYDHALFLKSKVYYWNFVYDGSSDSDIPDAYRECQKKPGQRFWAVTYATGAKRENIAEEVSKPTCLAAGVDHFMIVRESDLPAEYRLRNSDAFSHKHGVGMWVWKSYVQYLAMGRMNDGDILFYLDSDIGCSPHIMQYFCLAQNADVVPFHHSDPWYTMARLVRRDAMVLMDMDKYEVAQSVQFAASTIFLRKTPRSLEYVTSLAAWSQMYPVLCCFGASSVYSVDYPEYDESGKMHQCDQAISSLLITKFAFKSYPWDLGGFGAGSDDEQNHAQRFEAGLDENQLRIDMA